MATSHRSRRLCVTQLVALALLTTSGCIPVGWLPDSSGFVYTGGREFDRLIHYDLATAASRVLLEKMPAHCPTMAISPDGKRIAVAQLRREIDENHPETMQILMYDLEGKLVHTSGEFHWGANRRMGKDDHPNTGVFWIARAGVLLVQDYGQPGRSGIYNLEKNTMEHLLDGTPCVYGGTPVRTDGKGFLLVTNSRREPEVFVVDWKGKKERISLKWETKDPDIRYRAAPALLHSPWKGNSEWQGHVALVTYGTLRIRINTEKRTGTVDELPREDVTVDGKELLQHYAFARGGVKLRVLIAEKTKSRSPLAKEDVHLHVEMSQPAKNKPQLLLKVRNGFCCFSPSPDGKWVAIRSMSDTTQADQVVLVSETGEVRTVQKERQGF